MGLVKLAVVGGAGYWAVNKYRQNQKKSQTPQQQAPQQQHRDHPYQPDYYSHNTFRGADEDMYGPRSEKQHYPQYQSQERLPHQTPMQLNFVAPSQRTQAQFAESPVGKY
jgi:hypothetical protein